MKDFLGREIKIGDVIVYTVAHGGSAWLEKGVVTGFNSYMDSPTNMVDLVEFKYAGGTHSGYPNSCIVVVDEDPKLIYTRKDQLKNFVVVGEVDIIDTSDSFDELVERWGDKKGVIILSSTYVHFVEEDKKKSYSKDECEKCGCPYSSIRYIKRYIRDEDGWYYIGHTEYFDHVCERCGYQWDEEIGKVMYKEKTCG